MDTLDHLTDSARVDAALGAGLDAFWAAVARSYPEIQTGDVGFDDPLVDVARGAITRWVDNNAPTTDAGGQLRP